jgi:hypothetical protein
VQITILKLKQIEDRNFVLIVKDGTKLEISSEIKPLLKLMTMYTMLLAQAEEESVTLGWLQDFLSPGYVF